jgi:hypothetical protein
MIDPERCIGLADVPPYIEMQCYWYMAALDWDSWDDSRIYTVRRRDAKAPVAAADVTQFLSRHAPKTACTTQLPRSRKP